VIVKIKIKDKISFYIFINKRKSISRNIKGKQVLGLLAHSLTLSPPTTAVYSFIGGGNVASSTASSLPQL
jgi:hypothetical protein